jgi:hypothetical protein
MTGSSTYGLDLQRACGWWKQAVKPYGMDPGVRPEHLVGADGVFHRYRETDMLVSV